MASRQISPYPFIWQFYSESTGARSEIENYEKLTLNFFFKSSAYAGVTRKNAKAIASTVFPTACFFREASLRADEANPPSSRPAFLLLPLLP